MVCLCVWWCPPRDSHAANPQQRVLACGQVGTGQRGPGISGFQLCERERKQCEGRQELVRDRPPPLFLCKDSAWASASLIYQLLFGDAHQILKTRTHGLEKLWDLETQNQALEDGAPAARLSPCKSTCFATRKKEIGDSVEIGFFIKACGFCKPR